jgi:hypothetical protein
MAVHIIEVVCDKPPKGPTKDPTVNTTSVVEVTRAISSIMGRRRKLNRAIEKLQKAEQKLGKKDTEKNKVAVACGKLGVKAAKDWLGFTLKRYQMLKDKLDEDGTSTSHVKMAKLLAWGGPIVSGGQAHMGQYDDEGAPVAGAVMPSPIPDVKYDYKKVARSSTPWRVLPSCRRPHPHPRRRRRSPICPRPSRQS